MLGFGLEEIPHFALYFGKYVLSYSFSHLFLMLTSHEVNFTWLGPLSVYYLFFFFFRAGLLLLLCFSQHSGIFSQVCLLWNSTIFTMSPAKSLGFCRNYNKPKINWEMTKIFTVSLFFQKHVFFFVFLWSECFVLGFSFSHYMVARIIVGGGFADLNGFSPLILSFLTSFV